MRYAIAIASFAFVALVAGYYLLWPVTVMICDGDFDLTVRVQNASATPIRVVACHVFGDLKEAQESSSFPLSTNWFDSRCTKSNPYSGEELICTIPFSEHFVIPIVGTPYLKSEFQFKGLLVIVDYVDGKRVRRVVDIPHRSMSRIVEIDVP